MLINMRNALLSGGKRDIFADWYPRWGSEDIIFAFNGIYNAGADAEHSSSATSWIDVANGKTATRYNSSSSSPLWTDVGMRFDSTKRGLLLTLSLANVTRGFTFEAFGYYGVNWGIMGCLARSRSAISEVMPFASNTGASININSVVDYIVPSCPTTSDLCLTCDAPGNVVIYHNGTPVKTATPGVTAFNKLKTSNRLVIGLTADGSFPPNGSTLYGVTLYQDAISESEVAALYAANVKNYIG